MERQFVFKMPNHEVEEKRTNLPDFKTRSTENPRFPGGTTSSVGAMVHQRSSQFNERQDENMTSLHARLHQEADKIRKWKILTEQDLKEKDKKLTAASTQLETMKKSMLELQLDNEKLSIKMQEEIDNRQEIMEKIFTTRHMCDVLKSAATNLEDRLLHCETEKTELKYAGKEHAQHLEELGLKFENLRVSSETNQRKLLSQVEKEKIESLEKEKILVSKCEEGLSMVEQLNKDLQGEREVVLDLQNALQEKRSTLEELNKSFEMLRQENKTLQEDLISKDQCFKESSIRILTIQDEKHELEVKLEKCESHLHSLQASKDQICLEMTESCAKYEKDLSSAQESVSMLETGLENERTRLKSCQTELDETLTEVEKIKSSRDILTIEKTELQMQVKLQNSEITNLKRDIAEYKEEIQEMNAEKDDYITRIEREKSSKIQLQEIERNLQAQLCSLKLDRDKQQENVSDLTNDMNEVKIILSKERALIENLQEDIKCKEKELEDGRIEIHRLLETSDQRLKSMLEKDTDLLSKNAKILELEKQLKDQKKLTEDFKKESNQLKDDLEEFKRNCVEETRKADELINQLKDVNQEKEEHGKSLVSQQKKSAAQIKHNKELEKEVKSLRADLKLETKKRTEKEKTITSMKEEIDALEGNIKELEQNKLKCEEDMQALQEECVQDKKASLEAMTKAKEMQELAKKEKENSKTLTDCQLAEMMETLESYKQSSERIMAEKESEIKSLKYRVESLATKNESEKGELKDESKRLSSNIKVLSKEKDDLSNQLMEIADENKSLKKKIEDLEKQKEDEANFQSADFTKSPNLPSQSRIPQLSQAAPPVAPVTPQKHVACTPRTPKTPLQVKENQLVLKTPQRSIIRTSGAMSVSKRRKVAFFSDDQDMASSSDASMELDIGSQETAPPVRQVSLSNNYYTPRLAVVPESTCRLTPKRSRIPLNKPLHSSTPIQRSEEEVLERPRDTGTKLPKPEGPRTPNVRRSAPPKKTSKFFSTSPKDKGTPRFKTKTKAKPGESWFDMDSVYGFGPED